MSATDRQSQGDLSLERRHPGAYAEAPQHIPPKGWWEVIRRGWKEFSEDQMGLIAAGVAFKAFMSIVPALIAVILCYGLFTDPSQVESQVKSLSGAMPKSASELLQTQLENLVNQPHKGLGFGLFISLAIALWSASGGMSNLLQAVNDAYDESETRNWAKRKGLALALTIGAILVFAITATLVAAFPAITNALNPPTPVFLLLQAVRWLLVLIVIGIALAVIYRVAPDRDAPKMRWVSVGAVVATIIWIIISIGFSIYANNFSSYGKTYGSLAGVVVLLTWLWLTFYAILLGAEINAEAEKQTVKDTTVGDAKPRGERGALKADLGPDDPEPSPDEVREDTRQKTLASEGDRSAEEQPRRGLLGRFFSRRRTAAGAR